MINCRTFATYKGQQSRHAVHRCRGVPRPSTDQGHYDGRRRSWPHRNSRHLGLDRHRLPARTAPMAGPGSDRKSYAHRRNRRQNFHAETAYYLFSTPITAERGGEVVRSHWGVENRLHWHLDLGGSFHQHDFRIAPPAQQIESDIAAVPLEFKIDARISKISTGSRSHDPERLALQDRGTTLHWSHDEGPCQDRLRERQRGRPRPRLAARKQRDRPSGRGDVCG